MFLSFFSRGYLDKLLNKYRGQECETRSFYMSYVQLTTVYKTRNLNGIVTSATTLAFYKKISLSL